MSHPAGRVPPKRLDERARMKPVDQQPTRRNPDPMLTVEEIAGYLRVSTMTIYRMIHSGDLGAIRVGRSFRVPLSSYTKWMKGDVIASEAD